MNKNRSELRKIWAKFEPGYYEKGNLGQRLWHKYKFEVVSSVLPRDVERLLDVGCGDGYFIGELAHLIPETEIYAVDVSEKLIRSATKKHPGIKFQVADAHRLPFKNNQFDLILFAETLEHFVDPRKVLLQAKRVLKKDGKIIVEIDSGNILFRIIWFFWTNAGRGRVWKDAHLTSFNIKRLEKIFKEVGLKKKAKIIYHLGMAVTFILTK